MPVSTNGWDMVIAARLPQVNAEIAHAVATGSTHLPVIDWKSNDGSASLQKVIFDAWQFTSKGMAQTSGAIVRMRFPIKSGIFNFMGEQALGGITAIGTVRLGAMTDASHSKLVLDHRPGVSVEDIEAAVALPQKAALKMALTQAISAVIADFNHVFASVELNGQLAAAAPWLAPKAVDYCFMGGTSDSESFFATLCMTERFIAGNPLPPASVPAALIPVGAQAALVLSHELFMRNLLLPGVARGFAAKDHLLSRAELDAFQNQMFDLKHDEIVKREGTPAFNLPVQSIDLSCLYSLALVGSLTALPVFVIELMEKIAHGNPSLAGQMSIFIETLSIKEEQGRIVFRVGLRCPVATASPLPDIPVAIVRLDATATFDLDMQADGTVRFRQAVPPTHTTPQIDAPDWIKNSAPVVETILGLAATVVTIVTGGTAAFVIGAAYAGLVAEIGILRQLIERQVAGNTGAAAPAGLEKVILTAVSPVTWSEHRFKPTTVTLNGDLAFGGVLVDAP